MDRKIAEALRGMTESLDGIAETIEAKFGFKVDRQSYLMGSMIAALMNDGVENPEVLFEIAPDQFTDALDAIERRGPIWDEVLALTS